jgi:hypothetical protein
MSGQEKPEAEQGRKQGGEINIGCCAVRGESIPRGDVLRDPVIRQELIGYRKGLCKQGKAQAKGERNRKQQEGR